MDFQPGYQRHIQNLKSFIIGMHHDESPSLGREGRKVLVLDRKRLLARQVNRKGAKRCGVQQLLQFISVHASLLPHLLE